MCFLQKFSDDSAVVGCIWAGCEGEYRGTIRDFVDWVNHLMLIISKTKEMVIDFLDKKAQTRASLHTGNRGGARLKL